MCEANIDRSPVSQCDSDTDSYMYYSSDDSTSTDDECLLLHGTCI